MKTVGKNQRHIGEVSPVAQLSRGITGSLILGLILLAAIFSSSSDHANAKKLSQAAGTASSANLTILTQETAVLPDD